MEIKKSAEASIEGSKTALSLVGLLFVSSLVLVSFSYKAPSADQVADNGGARQTDAPIQEEVQDLPPPPEPETPVALEVEVEPQEDIQEEENTEDVPVATVPVPPPPIPPGPTQTTVKKEIIDFPDVEAQFPGGYAAMQQWIADHVQYPQTAIEMGDQGRVFLSFVVEPDGSITNVEVLKKVTKELDNEAKRLIRSMPKWSAGEAAGEKVRTRCQIPINFTLN